MTEPCRVLVLVDHDENRHVLADWLNESFEHVTARNTIEQSTDEEYDLCIVDLVAFQRNADALASMRHRVEPVFLPFLLMVPERQLERHGPNFLSHLDELLTDRIDEVFTTAISVDEFITTPLKKAELRRRIDQLLHTRTISLELKEQTVRYQTLLRSTPETIVLLIDGNIEYVNDAGIELFGVSRKETIEGKPFSDFVHADDRARIERRLAELRDGHPADSPLDAQLVSYDGSVNVVEISGVTVPYQSDMAVQLTLHDVTERSQREDELERYSAELERLDRINDVVRRVQRTILDADSRIAIERTLCEQLVEIDAYLFAWIGERQRLDASMTTRAWTTTDVADPDGLVGTLVSDGHECLIGDSLDDCRVRAIPNLMDDTTDDTTDEGVARNGAGKIQREALNRGFRSLVAVPLTYNEIEYGILAVFADRPNIFTGRELEGIEDLGNSIGHGIDAVERKRGLLSDRVLQLEFEVADSSDPVGELSAMLDCFIHIDEVLVQPNESLLIYASVHDSSSTAVRRAVAALPSVERVRPVAETEDGVLIELVIDSLAPIDELLETGGTITSLTADRGTESVVVTYPPDTDLRSLNDSASGTLVSKKTVERSTRSSSGLRPAALDALTEKQRSTVRTAFAAGYFDHPRASTGEEIAASLHISPSTFHQHLRSGLRNLLELSFEYSNGK